MERGMNDMSLLFLLSIRILYLIIAEPRRLLYFAKKEALEVIYTVSKESQIIKQGQSY